MRAFISLNIDLKSKKIIRGIQDLLKLKLKSNYNKHNRFENPKNFHITLFFIGDIEENKLNEIYENLKIRLEGKTGKMNFKCSEINAFPNLKKPEVLFLNCINVENKISGLAETIKNVMAEYEYTTDKNFHPHITLARLNNKINLNDLSDIRINVNFSVTKLSIIQSKITTEGAEHKEIFSINL